jgi:phage repressor protein C with HTH and peptisase S24 domain
MGEVQTEWLKKRKKEVRTTDARIASRIRRDRSIVNKIFNGELVLDLDYVEAFSEELRLTREELLYRFGVLDEPPESQHSQQPDLPVADPKKDYVPIEVLPSYAGMGGGGTGEGDREIALVSRSLIVDELKGKPSDFLLIHVRGDSMEPDFRQGDQILVDCRDCSPAQPGPFALWDGEWGEYVVKNVERARTGEVRIFSSNAKYSSALVESENTRIIGRPVWFGRRL